MTGSQTLANNHNKDSFVPALCRQGSTGAPDRPCTHNLRLHYQTMIYWRKTQTWAHNQKYLL